MLKAIHEQDIKKLASDLEELFIHYEIENFTWAAIGKDIFISRSYISHNSIKPVSTIQVLADLADLMKGFTRYDRMQKKRNSVFSDLRPIKDEQVQKLVNGLNLIFHSYDIHNFTWSAFNNTGLLNGLGSDEDVDKASVIKSIYDVSCWLGKDLQKADQEIQARKN